MQLSPQQLVLYETARALVESSTLEEASPRMVAAVCQAFGWQCGAIWQANRARKVMRCVGTWHTPGLAIEDFTAATRASVFERGVGLPGRAELVVLRLHREQRAPDQRGIHPAPTPA